MPEKKPAMYYEKSEDFRVCCYLCPHRCVIKPECLGACRVRKNEGGDLYTLNYGKIASMALDPIEKKPLYRFHPGSIILSAGTFGCNLKCSFCQNWAIAHENPGTADLSPDRLVGEAVKYKEAGNIGIAYTYNEPSIWYEYVFDCARLAKSEGLYNVLVTNGFIEAEPLEALIPYIDAVNIDVKAYTASFYSRICGGVLDDVKRTVEKAFLAGCHVEVTTLVIPDLNDSVAEIEEMCKWLSGISNNIPLHLTRFFPNYKMRDKKPTPVKTLERAALKAQEYLEYVYTGNVWQ